MESPLAEDVSSYLRSLREFILADNGDHHRRILAFRLEDIDTMVVKDAIVGKSVERREASKCGNSKLNTFNETENELDVASKNWEIKWGSTAMAPSEPRENTGER